jgi:LysR family glycine cleavage system transcriptional activator
LPSLNSLRAFEAAARHLHMTRAAEELHVTQGAVSRHVINLEEFLEVDLFHRTSSGICLTEAGASYYSMIGGALSDLYAGHASFVRNNQRDILKVKLPPTFAMRWLVPRLHRFHAAYPELAAQIMTSHERVDFANEDVDVAIWSTSETIETPRMIRLFGETLVPVCSPRLLETGPQLSEPSDLRNHVLLYSMNRPEDWSVWLSAMGATSIGGHGSITFENSGLAYQSAVDCAGVAIAQPRLVRDDIRLGRLIVPFRTPVRSKRGYYLLAPHGPLPRRVDCFKQWLSDEIARDCETDDLVPEDRKAPEPARFAAQRQR